MDMFCYQCQEAAKNTGCTTKGICGKSPEVSALLDVLTYTAKGVAIFSNALRENGYSNEDSNHYLLDALFTSITNVNFDNDSICDKILKGLALRDSLREKTGTENIQVPFSTHDAATWTGNTMEDFIKKAQETGVLSTKDENIRSLRELLIYGVKGIAAYADHACNLGFEDEKIHRFIEKALISTINPDISMQEYVNLVMECGEYGVKTMALLDKAHTTTYGHPEMTRVNIGTGSNPGILISGHDLKDMEELLKQTEGTGIDVYTHSEMLPAHYYPKFKQYSHFVGNYGGSWWNQRKEFESFNGPILFTTNCLVPPLKTAGYADKVYTTGSVGFPGFKHLTKHNSEGQKDFTEVIEHAKKCPPPVQIEEGTITGGFAHDQIFKLADKITDAVKSGAIKRFFVMAGCDGRMKSREYYTKFASALPEDTVILTAGCAKYRYNKLPLGDIDGIPRVLDAGQCNDSYSLAVVAMKLKEIFELNDINELPISYNIAWYEQKAVIVLLALLSLGVKNIKLGPTLPAFLSEDVAGVLVNNFGINGISTVEQDKEQLMA